MARYRDGTHSSRRLATQDEVIYAFIPPSRSRPQAAVGGMTRSAAEMPQAESAVVQPEPLLESAPALTAAVPPQLKGVGQPEVLLAAPPESAPLPEAEPLWELEPPSEAQPLPEAEPLREAVAVAEAPASPADVSEPVENRPAAVWTFPENPGQMPIVLVGEQNRRVKVSRTNPLTPPPGYAIEFGTGRLIPLHSFKGRMSYPSTQ